MSTVKQHVKTTMVLREVAKLVKRGIPRKDFPGYLQGRGYTNPRGELYTPAAITTFLYLLKHGTRSGAGYEKRGRPSKVRLLERRIKGPKTGLQLRAALKLIQKVTSGELVSVEERLEAIQEVLDVLR